ncbi:MAG: endonuclease III [Planctomycetales bacterium]|nr:endonuclease III [Planctomycetales bacterium]
MNRQQRAAYVFRRLNELYPETPIPLDHRDSFTLLVAVLLSAQCTDKRVNQIAPLLWEALGDTPEELAAAEEEDIEEIIRPCGLAPRKSKAIKALSQQLLDEHGGEVPDSAEALEQLPGVGHKTASVVLCQAFGQPAFPVDTHIHRLAQRWGLTSGQNVVRTERDLKRLFPEKSWGKLHLQFIFYGREHCTARGCDGTRCEICRACYPRRKRPLVTRKA